MDLDISQADIARSLGRAQVELTHAFVRNLEAADLLRLEVEQGVKPPSVSRISDRHHALARALANGDAPGEAAIKTGYSSSRISILQNDPAFVELLEFYRTSKNLAEAQVMDRLNTLTLSAVALLEDRLENEPDNLKNRELLDIATVGLDRSGHGPASKLQVTSLTITAEDMKKLAENKRDVHVTVLEARPKGAGASGGRVPEALPMASPPSAGLEGEGLCVREGGGEGTEGQVSYDPTEERAVAQVLRQPWDFARAARSLSDMAPLNSPAGV